MPLYCCLYYCHTQEGVEEGGKDEMEEEEIPPPAPVSQKRRAIFKDESRCVVYDALSY
jgi:hypothetical protein